MNAEQEDEMMPIDRSDIYRRHRGQWVALKDDQITVVAAASTLEEASEEASKAGYPDAIFTKVPQKLTYFVGC
jgi:hypothetical protein